MYGSNDFVPQPTAQELLALERQRWSQAQRVLMICKQPHHRCYYLDRHKDDPRMVCTYDATVYCRYREAAI